MSMTNSDVFHYRRVVKHQVMLERGGVCDMCGKNPAIDLHECVSRGITKRGSDERWASYDRRICSILCRDCHDKAHSPNGRTVLLRVNIERYGYAAVQAAFDAVNVQGLDFPEKEGGDEPDTSIP
jgi:hypothetical protein